MFKIGDKVKSDYFPKEENIVRKITDIHKDPSCGCGYRASADAGEPCKCCGRIGTQIFDVGADWFKEVKP